MQVVSHGRRDAIIFLLSNDEAGGCIQDGLEWTHVDCTGGAKNAVAVIHAWYNFCQICIYYKWDSHWSIVICKRYFRSLLGKFILIVSYELQYSWWDTNDFSELKVLRHLKHTYLAWPCFDVFKYYSLLISVKYFPIYTI